MNITPHGLAIVALFATSLLVRVLPAFVRLRLSETTRNLIERVLPIAVFINFAVYIHDFQQTAISRTLPKENDNFLLVASIIGFSSIRKFDELHVRTRLMSTDTQQGALRAF